MSDSFAEIKHELYELMRRMPRGRFASPPPEGLTPAECRIIVAVDEMERSGDIVRPRQIAAFCHTTPSSLSQTLKSLEEKGFINRKRTGDDYRGIAVSLTEAGTRFAEEGRRRHDEHLDHVMAYLGEEDMRHFVRILKKVVEFHEQSPHPCASAGTDAELRTVVSPHHTCTNTGDDVSCE